MARRVGKFIKRLFIALAVLGVVTWISFTVAVKLCIAKPPPVPPEAQALRQLAPVVRDGRTWLGNSWMENREGLPAFYVAGTPYEMGHAAGLLTKDLHYTLEGEFLEMIRSYVPREWVLNIIRDYIIIKNRNLPRFVDARYQMEILGGCVGGPDIRPELGDYYNRRLNYHAAHDLSYLLMDNPLVAMAGCTAFGAWGKATADGHLITGRNFDWEAADVFSRDRVVQMYEPDRAIPFLAVSWAGMVGVVSGMNRAGVSITMNGAPSELPDSIASPSAFVARAVLEKAHNLAEAVAILSNANVFVSTLWLVGSRADGRFICVEKTPTATRVREPDGDSIVCANHFLTEELKDGAKNREYRAESTSVSRDARMVELLRETHGEITPVRAVEILRDRKLPGGDFPGFGHRSTLNPHIATHAVIMDLTAGIVWVALPPHQLGKFVAFDVADFGRRLPDQALSADPLLAAGEFERTRAAQLKLKSAEDALRGNDAKAALEAAEAAEKLNPGFYQNASVKGRALLAIGRRDEARVELQRALDARPAFAQERRELEEMLRGDNARK